MAALVENSNPHNFSWQQTMLRIKDPSVSVPFYEKNFGFTLIHKYDFPQWKFALYFLEILPKDQPYTLTPGTPEAENYLWTMPGTCLELTHNYGSESDEAFKVNNGNVEPFRGFGHIAVMTPDVYKASADLEAAGVRFQKRPDEGRMKGIAFALDPDGYWIELVPRRAESPHANEPFTLAQTMIRVKDPKRSLAFYSGLLGMTKIREAHHSDFSLYFLAHLRGPEQAEEAPKDPLSPDASRFIDRLFQPVIELTHNHGTENDPAFSYHNGNDEDLQAGKLRGFGHVGFLVEDLDAACTFLESQGVPFKKRPQEGNMRGLAFAYDPDGYWVEIIQRGGLSMLK
eukprot:gene7866-8678_t